jgi:hypothetical protein
MSRDGVAPTGSRRRPWVDKGVYLADGVLNLLIDPVGALIAAAWPHRRYMAVRSGS